MCKYVGMRLNFIGMLTIVINKVGCITLYNGCLQLVRFWEKLGWRLTV